MNSKMKMKPKTSDQASKGLPLRRQAREACRDGGGCRCVREKGEVKSNKNVASLAAGGPSP